MDAAVDYAAFRQIYLSMQQTMETGIGNLRGRLRTKLSAGTPGMSRLAEVDAVMERALSPRERSLLATVPGDEAAALTTQILQNEVGDWNRFDNRRQVASLTGLCPGVRSSGLKHQTGPITKHGNPRLFPRPMRAGDRFAGRRKPGGGYTYYDFMQNRNFDIAGPNPTADERKQIDREYMGFLDAQRREAISAELAKKQNERLQADLEGARQPLGPPMILLPRKRPLDRSKSGRCEEASLSCSWEKFSAAVKNAFASSPKAKP